jgi:apolipoprotein N-acyltransferase
VAVTGRPGLQEHPPAGRAGSPAASGAARRAARSLPAAGTAPPAAGTAPPAAGTLLRIAAGAGAGYAQGLTAPPHEWWPCGVLGAALLIAAVRGARPRTGALAGAGYGAALFLPLLTWVSAVGTDAYWLLSLAMVLWLALLGAGLSLVSRLRGWPLWAACLWVAEEWARDRVPFGGFTWGRLAFGQTHSPMTPLAALGGAPLLTFAVALAGSLLVAAGAVLFAGRRGARPGRRWAVAARVAGAVAGVGVLVGIGAAVPVPNTGQASAAGPASVVVAAVQGNVPRLGVAGLGQGWAVLADHVRETDRLARAVAAGRAVAPQIVIWPENASQFDPTVNPQARALVDQAVAAVDRPVLVGAVLNGPGPAHLRNAGIVWTPTGGPGAEYVKRHLVPFGEYVPFRSVLAGLISSFRMVPRDFVPGRRPGVLQLGPARIGDVICFEVTFDGAVRDAVTAGGRLLTVQTNDADYEHAGQPWNTGESAQQLAVGQLRAVEHGRAVVVASTSGVSALIDPDGTIVAHSGVGRPAVLEARLPLRDSLTLADRLGPLPEYLLTGVGLAALALAALGTLVRRRTVGSAGSPAAGGWGSGR